jgi:hypothetical protein
MKTPLALLLTGLVLVGCKLVEPPPPPPPPPVNGIGFFANCEMRPGALELVGEGEKSQYTFSLRNKDVGGCDTDKLANKRAPYWERAELSQQGYLDFSEPQILNFDARFRDGFSGKQENFLQIQNFNLTCPATPSLMLKWHKGELELSLLQASGVLKPKRYPDMKVEKFRSWKNWQVRFARTSKTTLAIDVVSDGERIGRGHLAYLPECGTQYVKFGISRPGNSYDENQTSIAQFRNFSLKPLNPPKKVTAKITAKGPPLRQPLKEVPGFQNLVPKDPPMMVKKPKPRQLKDLPLKKVPFKNEIMIARKSTTPLKIGQKDLPAIASVAQASTPKAAAPKFSNGKVSNVKRLMPATEMQSLELTITRMSSQPIVPAELTIIHKSSTPLQ